MSCLALDDYQRVDVTDLRRLIGGRRRLRGAEAVTLHLAAADVTVELTKCASNLGGGRWYQLMVCPICSRRVAALRLLPGGTGAACRSCLHDRGARYSSQLQPGS